MTPYSLSWKGVMLHVSQKKVSNDNIGVRETDYYEVKNVGYLRPEGLISVIKS